MMDLNSYNKEKSTIIENVQNYINNSKRAKEISESAKLPLNFDEPIKRLESILQSLIDDKVRVSVLAEVSSGKSTFLNALIFRESVLDARIGEATARLYHISYGEEYTVKYKNSERKINSLKEIKEFIQQLNKETIDKAKESEDGKKVLSISEDELNVFIYMPLEHLKVGIEIIDTPGFGTLNEELMMELIKKAIYSSDAVITILDISEGIKKDESEKFSKLLSMIKPDKRYIVFNKIDAYEDEENDFNSVGESAIDSMNKILKNQGYDQKIDMKQLFYVSSKYALKGFTELVKGNTVDERNRKYVGLFEEFEREFWNNVINYKQKEFLNGKISSFEMVKKSESEEVNRVYKNLKNQLLSLEAEKDNIMKKQLYIIKLTKKLEKKPASI